MAESFSESSDYETDTSDDQQQLSPVHINSYTDADADAGEPKKWADVDTTDFLHSMISYQAQTNASPNADIDAFLVYVKKELNVADDVTERQLKDKIRHLKNKYDAYKAKHFDSLTYNVNEVFLLMDKLWGDNNKMSVVVQNGNTSKADEALENVAHTIANDTETVNGNGTETVEKVVESTDTDTEMETVNGNETETEAETDVNGNGTETETETDTENGDEIEAENENVEVEKKPNENGLCDLINEDKLLRIGAELFEGDEDVEGADKWRKLDREEMELCLKQLDVKSAKMKLVLAAMDMGHI